VKRGFIHASLLVLLAVAVWQVYRIRDLLDSAVAPELEIERLRARLQSMPLTLAGGTYQGRRDEVPAWIVDRSGADAHVSIVYADASGREYRLYVGGAARAKGYFHRPDGCMPSVGWQLALNETRPFTAFRTRRSDPTMRRLEARHGANNMLVYYWFQAGGDVSASDLASSYFRFRNILESKLATPSYVVTVYVPSRQDEADPDARGEQFLRALGPPLQQVLEGGM
jgi:EpsI family protein